MTLIYIIFTNTVENLQTEKDEEAKGREQNLVSKSYYEMMQSLDLTRGGNSRPQRRSSGVSERDF